MLKATFVRKQRAQKHRTQQFASIICIIKQMSNEIAGTYFSVRQELIECRLQSSISILNTSPVA